jgi:general secretion pathway protein E
VNEIIKKGILKKASDIHIKFDDLDGMEIKYRIDGILQEVEELFDVIDKKILERNVVEIISRIKILSEMNVAEKRKPQDGSFSFLLDEKRYDVRVAYMPTINGESIVLRILKSFLENTELKTLGFSNESEEILEKMLERKYGMILVSGPTGSGKSTTLLSMIEKLNDGKRKIITVEDPVENKIKGIVQVQVNNEIGVTFSEVLKSCLRNDPDIIVVSEIRDEITAEIAVRAALTGHLVISTIHTNNAIATITRLVDMGIPKYLILDSMIGVVAQRLIGKKCDNYSNHLDEHSCNRCNNGYDGRIVINEILYLNEEVKNILKKNELGEKVKKEIKELETAKYIDFSMDVNEKIEKNLIFEKDAFEFS